MKSLLPKIRMTDSKIIVIALIFLSVLSLASIYSGIHRYGELTEREVFYRQIEWLIISWLVLIIFSFINYRIYFDLSYILYAVNTLLLVTVYIFGKTAMGAQRWLSIFGLSFQPSEFSKIIVILLLAKLFSEERNKTFLKGFLFPFILVMINVAIIFKQPDLGTALILIFLFFTLGLFSHVPKRYFAVFIALALLLSPLAPHFLKDYQKKRLMVFINPNIDPLGAGYTIIQSKIAIGSGQLSGKGFLGGTQNQFNFLPERHTDFIFTVIAEEWGFLGTVLLLIIYFLLLRKMLQITESLHDAFAYYCCLGINLLFFIEVFVNIGMTLGILPVVGVPLLFLSYGGTHLVTTFLAMGIFLNIYRYD